MPQLSGQENQPTATSIQENKPFRERLRDRYKPLDNVRVINIDSELYKWQYFPIDGETEEFTDNGAVRVITGRTSFVGGYSQRLPGHEQVWELGPGDSEVLIGANADLFIEGLYKHLVAKKKVRDHLGVELSDMDALDPKQRRETVNFNWNDGLLQEQMINKIFLGVVKPNFDDFKQPARPGSSTQAE